VRGCGCLVALVALFVALVILGQLLNAAAGVGP
jgi:hypothetical protein